MRTPCLPRRPSRAALALLLCAAAPALAAQTPAVATADALLAATCFSCHGPEGRSAGAMPAIAGKDPAYIAGRMRDWRSDRLHGTVMNRIAKGFTDGEIERLAAYFASR